MAQIKLTAADAADMPRIRALYKQAFPSAERMPFWMLRRKVRAGLAELLCIAEMCIRDRKRLAQKFGAGFAEEDAGPAAGLSARLLEQAVEESLGSADAPVGR